MPVSFLTGIFFMIMLVITFVVIAAQHQTRPEDESHSRQNGGVPKQVGRPGVHRPGNRPADFARRGGGR